MLFVIPVSQISLSVKHFSTSFVICLKDGFARMRPAVWFEDEASAEAAGFLRWDHNRRDHNRDDNRRDHDNRDD